MNEYDLTIIGGGSAGLVLAVAGAKLGVKTALVEKHRLGGRLPLDRVRAVESHPQVSENCPLH